MGASWNSATLAEVSFVTDFSANGSFADLRENVEYLSKPDYAILIRLVDFSRNWDRDFVYIPQHSWEFLRKCQLEVGDVIIANIGANAGTLFRVPDLKQPSALGPNALVIKTDKFPSTSKEFLYYYFISPDGQNQIQSIITGSAQPKFTKTDLRNLKIPFPSFTEQRAIAGILGALDDKIELNRRMNRTLESMARAVFRQWFMDGEEANGWENLKWGDIATLEYGKSLTDYQSSNAQYPVYGTNGAIGRSVEYLYPSEGIIIGRKGAYRGIHYSPEPFFVIDTAFYLKPTRPFSMKWAYYELLRIDLNGMDSGSAIPSTSRTDFYNLPVVFPPSVLITSFDEFVSPLYAKIYANEKESTTLASLRDTLLPKLMRGEVKVKEV